MGREDDPINGTVYQDEAVPTPPPAERTIVGGYLVAIPIAFIVYQITDALWQEGNLSLFNTYIVFLFDVLMVAALWVAAAIPFAVVRMLRGSLGFSTPGRAIASGAIVGLLTIPIAFRFLWIADIEASYRSFGLDLMWTLEHRSWLFALSGAVAGLAYWMVEFAWVPSMLVISVGKGCRVIGRKE